MKLHCPPRALVAAIVIATASVVVCRGAYAQAPPRELTVSLNPSTPIPYEPVTVTVSGDGCPAQDNTVEIGATPGTDASYVSIQLPKTATVPVEPGGHWTATITFPIAYPGSWWIWDHCFTGSAMYTIPDPSDWTPNVLPTNAIYGTRGVASGKYCAGGHLQYNIAPDIMGTISIIEHPAQGSIPTNPDGSWEGEIWFSRFPHHDQKFRAWCGFPDGTVIYYPPVDVTVVAEGWPPPDSSTTTTAAIVPPSAAPTSVAPVKITPHFTG